MAKRRGKTGSNAVVQRAQGIDSERAGRQEQSQRQMVLGTKAIEQQPNKIRNASRHRGIGDKASIKVLSWAEGGIPVPEKVVEAACPLGLGP